MHYFVSISAAHHAHTQIFVEMDFMGTDLEIRKDFRIVTPFFLCAAAVLLGYIQQKAKQLKVVTDGKSFTSIVEKPIVIEDCWK